MEKRTSKINETIKSFINNQELQELVALYVGPGNLDVQTSYTNKSPKAHIVLGCESNDLTRKHAGDCVYYIRGRISFKFISGIKCKNKSEMINLRDHLTCWLKSNPSEIYGVIGLENYSIDIEKVQDRYIFTLFLYITY